MKNNSKNRISDNNTCLTYEIIKDYHEGKLSAEDMRKVEEHIIDCPLCSDAFDGYEFANKENFQNDILDIEAKIERKVRKRNNLRTVLLSSAALFAIFALSFLLSKSQEDAGTRIFAQYFKPFPDVTLHTRGNNEANIFGEAMQLYDAGKYSQAIEKFNILKNDSNDYRIKFYNGVANIAVGNYESGINLLSGIAHDTSNDYFAEANWYTALAYLKLNRIEEAERNFSLIANNSDYKSQIAKIKKELKEND